MSHNIHFTNGKVFTANEEKPYATDFIVKDGIISWIGEAQDLPEKIEKTVDLKDQRVIPGIIDAHLHPLYLADVKSSVSCSYPHIQSIEDLKESIKERRELQGEGQWIEGWGYDEEKLKEGRSPQREDLDAAAPDVPVVIFRTCGHIVCANSKALELAGIADAAKEVAGGEIECDASGRPTGVLKENARYLVLDIKAQKSPSQYAEDLVDLGEDLLSYGITGISELMGEHEPLEYLTLYKDAIEKGLKQRVAVHYGWDEFQKLDIDEKMKDHHEQAFLSGIKVFTDGSVSGRTAWVDEPFLSDPETYGISTTTPEILKKARDRARAEGVQLTIHAMGEQAIRQIVETVGDSEPWLEEAPSIRIEHGSFMTPELIKQIAKNKIAVVPQPIFLFAEIESYLKNVGAERTEHAYPIKTMLENSIPVAITSDAPATSWHDTVNPFIGIQSAVTRLAHDGTNTGQSEAIDLETALRLYTKAAQYVSNFTRVGQLKTGYTADFVILNEDILEIDPTTIKDCTVKATYMAGEEVYKQDRKS